jgi:hypothetical protein
MKAKTPFSSPGTVTPADGEHENPDLDVIRAIVRSRLGSAAERSANPSGKETGQVLVPQLGQGDGEA